MRYFVSIAGKETVVDVSELPGGTFDVKLVPPDDASGAEPRTLSAETFWGGTGETLGVDGHVYDLVIDGEMPKFDVFASGKRASIDVESARMRAAAHVRGAGGGGGGVIKSPMPGKVVKLLVQEGDAVEVGAPLVVVEAMKMENELVAEKAGAVKKVHVSQGDAVEGGARLITIG
jgi:biotin carboxyl carrier protein